MKGTAIQQGEPKPEAAVTVGETTTGEPTAGEAGLDGSNEAKRLAAAILEVLAGTRGPSEAAQVLGISLARYYQLETRALAGLLAGCEPRRRGGRRGASELSTLRQECERLRRECARQQSLVRAAQRTVGLVQADSPPPAPQAGTARKRRKRRPKARALKVAAQLRQSEPAAGPVIEERSQG